MLPLGFLELAHLHVVLVRVKVLVGLGHVHVGRVHHGAGKREKGSLCRRVACQEVSGWIEVTTCQLTVDHGEGLVAVVALWAHTGGGGAGGGGDGRRNDRGGYQGRRGESAAGPGGLGEVASFVDLLVVVLLFVFYFEEDSIASVL